MMHRDLAACPHPEKQAYRCKSDAQGHLQALRRGRRGSLRPGTLNVYLCACGMWHVGHTSILERLEPAR